MKQTNYHLFDFMDFDRHLQRDERLWKCWQATDIREYDGDIILTVPFQCQKLQEDMAPDTDVPQESQTLTLRAYSPDMLRLFVTMSGDEMTDHDDMLELADEAESAGDTESAEMMAEEAAETGSAAEEIGAMQQILSAYGFSFFDLSDSSPKAEKTRRQCALAVRTLIEDTALISRMQASKTLPIRELALRRGVSKKLLERHRKYIIAAAEILTGDYPVLGEYLRPIRKAVT